MIYIHASGIHNTIPSGRQPDLMRELKELTGRVYRRSDHFIQLAVIGAHKAAGGRNLPKQTAIYLTSGQGNISVFARICRQRHIDKMLPRPVDFINLLSNSAGFYVAGHLGLQGKNLFLGHHCFPVQMTMLAAQNEIKLGRQQAVLIGGVDEWFAGEQVFREISGLEQTTVLGEGSNWLLLSLEARGALAAFRMEQKAMDREELAELLLAAEQGARLAFSYRFPPEKIAELMNINKKCHRYQYEETCGYYETLPLYVLNRFLAGEKGRLLHIDGNEGRYMVMQVTTS